MSSPQTAYETPPDGWRTFVIVWATQSISVIGSAVTFFAITIWLATTAFPLASQRAELSLALATVAVAFGAPVIFAAPIAGAWADRRDRKRTMISMDCASAAIDLTIIALLLTHMLQVWMLVIILVAAAVVGAFHNSAFDASYAMLVPQPRLPRANGMMQTIFSLAGIVAPTIAVTLIALPDLAYQGHLGALNAILRGVSDGTPLAIGFDTATFLLAAVTPLRLHIPSPVRADRDETGKLQTSLWADVRQGALYIWHRRPMLWLLGTFTVANFVGGVFLLEALVVKFNLVGDWSRHGFTLKTALALVTTVSSIGGVAGGIFISTWGGLRNRRILGVLVPMIIGGLALIGFGLSPWLFVVAGMGFVESATVPILNAHSQAIWQGQVPRELQGRVFSVRRLIAQFTNPISTAIMGWLGGLFNPGAIFVAMGALYCSFCVAQLFNPYLRRVEDREWLEALAEKAAAAQT
jgi:DHA3 family macrolide efflux protein-like MFS transporter